LSKILEQEILDFESLRVLHRGGRQARRDKNKAILRSSSRFVYISELLCKQYKQYKQLKNASLVQALVLSSIACLTRLNQSQSQFLEILLKFVVCIPSSTFAVYIMLNACISSACSFVKCFLQLCFLVSASMDFCYYHLSSFELLFGNHPIYCLTLCLCIYPCPFSHLVLFLLLFIFVPHPRSPVIIFFFSSSLP
jgi:hypothetical protein